LNLEEEKSKILACQPLRRCKLLKSIGYTQLILFSVLLGLAPFVPEPHLFEKIKMLIAGTLHKPIDIFDLFFHTAPIIALVVKFVSEKMEKNK
jgi:hypothetical protein